MRQEKQVWIKHNLVKKKNMEAICHSTAATKEDMQESQ